MNLDGSNQVQITHREDGFPLLVTPDGKSVYFFSGLTQKIWRVALESGEETQLSERTVQSPAFSKDGKLVAYFVAHTKERSLWKWMSVDSHEVINTLRLKVKE